MVSPSSSHRRPHHNDSSRLRRRPRLVPNERNSMVATNATLEAQPGQDKADEGVGSTTTKQPEPAGYEPVSTHNDGVKPVATAK